MEKPISIQLIKKVEIMQKKDFIKKYLIIVLINIPIWLFIIFINGGMRTVSLSNIESFNNYLKNPFFLFWSLVFYFGFCYFMTKSIYEKKKIIWLRRTNIIFVGALLCLIIIITMFPISFMNNELLKGFILSFLIIIIILSIYLITEKKIIIYKNGTVVISNIRKIKLFMEDIKDIFIDCNLNNKHLKIITDHSNFNIIISMSEKDIIKLKEKLQIIFCQNNIC